MILLNKLWPLD